MTIFRSNIFTAQEHALVGSSVEEKYKRDPYRPLAVVDDITTVTECNRLRTEEGELWNVLSSSYWGVKGLWGVATLERLDLDEKSQDYGRTIQDPELIRIMEGEDLSVQKAKFPFKRGKLRFRKELRGDRK